MIRARRLSLPCCTAVACWLLASSAPAAAERPARGFADPLLGRWDLTIDSADGPYPSWLDVRLRTEWQLMGSFVGRFGSTRHVGAIRYDDGELEFNVPVQYESHADDLRFTGRLDGERLSGTTLAADGTVLRWSGARAPSLARAGGVDWGEPIELFNGRDLDGWWPRHERHEGCWRVADGLLSATPPCVDLVTEEDFGDFRLRAEFRYPEGSNSGLYLRGRYELQIQDDRGTAADPLRMGGVYGFLRPATVAAGAPGDWQTYDITLVGRRVSVVLNGVTVIDDREIPGITGGALDSHEALPGPLMVQGDHGPISFRRITLTPAR